MKKIIAVVLILSLSFSLSVSAFASNTSDNSHYVSENYESSEEIIGYSNKQSRSVNDNMIVLYWVANAANIIIYVENTGRDTVDYVAGTVTVASGTPIPFAIYGVSPIGVHSTTVHSSMTHCDEHIDVDFFAVKAGAQSPIGTAPGSRALPESLRRDWTRGTFVSVEASLEFHYGKHGLEVGALNIMEYAQRAKIYKEQVLSDLKELSPTVFGQNYTFGPSEGFTPSTKYKHKVSKQFIILSNVESLIVSYGGDKK